MKSPVSHVNVTVVAERVIAIGGFPPSARIVSRRLQMAGGCGARIVMWWTAGSMAITLHERMFARERRQATSAADGSTATGADSETARHATASRAAASS